MRRKMPFLIAALCALPIMIGSVAVVAQSREKEQEPKSGAWQVKGAPFTRKTIRGTYLIDKMSGQPERFGPEY
jgi:hypothetical protein